MMTDRKRRKRGILERLGLKKVLRTKIVKAKRTIKRKVLRKVIRRTYDENQKIAWYVYKFSASCGEFRRDPTENNFARLKQTAEQVSERLGVKLNKVLEIAERYKRDPSTDLKVQFNDEAVQYVLALMLLGEEKLEKGAVSE
jgi:hypothetical protein